MPDVPFEIKVNTYKNSRFFRLTCFVVSHLQFDLIATEYAFCAQEGVIINFIALKIFLFTYDLLTNAASISFERYQGAQARMSCRSNKINFMNTVHAKNVQGLLKVEETPVLNMMMRKV